ncbi:MAG: AraC family transcriptional regulator [Phycisphaeraceae bacterium]
MARSTPNIVVAPGLSSLLAKPGLAAHAAVLRGKPAPGSPVSGRRLRKNRPMADKPLRTVAALDDSDTTTFAFDVTRGPNHPDLVMRWGGREALIHDQPIHTVRQYPYSVIKYVLHGRGICRNGTQHWTIEPGMALWNRAGQESVLQADRGQRLISYVVMVFGDQSASMLDQCLHVPVAATALAHPQQVRAIMEVIMDEGLSPSEHTGEICSDLTKVLLRRIDTNIRSSVVSNAIARATYRRCREYIAAHFARIKSIGEAAQGCGVTVPYLCRLFDLFNDVTAHAYMTRLKLGTAEYLLLRGSTPVKTLAAAVGYEDFRLFSRNFKTLYGQSPREYRQRHSRRRQAVR